MCCGGHECCGMGLPIEPPVCSDKCYDKYMHTLKEGNKLLCKKNYQNNNVDIFTFGEKYIIIDTDIYDVYHFYLFDTKTQWLCNKQKNIGYPYLWDIFYTEQELRKIKLKKLCQTDFQKQ